jgi:hypothetical protein
VRLAGAIALTLAFRHAQKSRARTERGLADQREQLTQELSSQLNDWLKLASAAIGENAQSTI